VLRNAPVVNLLPASGLDRTVSSSARVTPLPATPPSDAMFGPIGSPLPSSASHPWLAPGAKIATTTASAKTAPTGHNQHHGEHTERGEARFSGTRTVRRPLAVDGRLARRHRLAAGSA
jgi:hypothetical protein